MFETLTYRVGALRSIPFHFPLNYVLLLMYSLHQATALLLFTTLVPKPQVYVAI